MSHWPGKYLLWKRATATILLTNGVDAARLHRLGRPRQAGVAGCTRAFSFVVVAFWAPLFTGAIVRPHAEEARSRRLEASRPPERFLVWLSFILRDASLRDAPQDEDSRTDARNQPCSLRRGRAVTSSAAHPPINGGARDAGSFRDPRTPKPRGFEAGRRLLHEAPPLKCNTASHRTPRRPARDVCRLAPCVPRWTYLCVPPLWGSSGQLRGSGSTPPPATTSP
jgi:hypothetical protein